MFSKEIKNNLSKYKYIYKIYYRDNTYHIEHFPIIYINNDYIYFKNSKCSNLDYLRTDNKNIYTNIKDAISYLEKYLQSFYTYSVYYIDKYNENIDIKKLKEKWVKEKKEKEIKEKEDNLVRAKREFEKALKELEEVKNV